MYNVVVIINGGTRSIERKLLDELAQAAGADDWELVDLPDTQRGLTTHEAVTWHTCRSCAGVGYLKGSITLSSDCGRDELQEKVLKILGGV